MRDRALTLAAVLFVLLLINTAYIAALPSPTVFYMGNVALHLALGLALAGALWFLLLRERRAGALGAAADRTPAGGAAAAAPRLPRAALALFAAALAAGLALVVVGNVTQTRWLLWTHIVAASLAVVAFVPYVVRLGRRFLSAPSAAAGWGGERAGRLFARAFWAAAALLVVLPAAAILYRRAVPDPAQRIRNPTVVPVSMNQEGGGPHSPFFPSSAKTNVGGIIPANFFTESDTCGECHKDIYRQWSSSVHHFASFNNQFYRKSIEYMQDVVGTQPSKWCAGCHDHAVFFNGRFERPIKEQIDTTEARAGLACTSCHAITHVDSSMGNGDYTIAYPPLHELVASRNPLLKRVNHFLTYLNPGPHKQTFMKPFMRADSAEFCSSCHKVHLDVPVNAYRWFRGFNDYDAWQASGVSGQGARSFYYPKESKNCAGCHMPLVPSQDPGNHDGQVHSHRFAAANMAVAYVNHDAEQQKEVEKFLKSGFITVDIFAAAPEESQPGAVAMVRRADEPPRAESSFAVGEESEAAAGPAVLRDVGRVAAPLDRAGTAFQPGSTVKVDVVARTRTIGHFFPGGTVDAFDVWLELQARDATGRVIYWSGSVEDGGRGPVEPGAHFYRSVQLDGAGNVINKRNAWQTRSVIYVRLIPPGAADVAHYRVRIPADAKGPLTFTARLNYRKFSHYYTQFVYAGQPLPGQSKALLGKDFNNLEYGFAPSNIPANVSGEIKGEIPALPIVAVASARLELPLGGGGAPAWRPVVNKKDRERWNDWGIGLLLQGDLKGAEYAFKKVTEAEPSYADGWLNVARALIREGEIEAAKPFVARALAIDPKLGRIYFFKAMIEKVDGDYDAALASLAAAEKQFPRDRVVLNQEARVLFLQRKYAAALAVLDRVCVVDPEDLQMHYTAMLCHRALGHRPQAEREAALFRRFKADEAAQAITAVRRRLSPEDNNERQAIHEHDSAPLTAAAGTATVAARPAAPAPPAALAPLATPATAKARPAVEVPATAAKAGAVAGKRLPAGRTSAPSPISGARAPLAGAAGGGR
ncbi:MAG TPA: tetratricopeptide repeat protein [Thermoanaerobaculia bacterium]|nr:tetratricopeptide repeat protein [Thermoanaerobaculia bacterium]